MSYTIRFLEENHITGYFPGRMRERGADADSPVIGTATKLGNNMVNIAINHG